MGGGASAAAPFSTSITLQLSCIPILRLKNCLMQLPIPIAVSRSILCQTLWQPGQAPFLRTDRTVVASLE